MNQTTRLSLVDRTDDQMSIVAQCRLLRVARSTLYYRPAPASDDDLRLMRRIDEQYLATPFYGSRRMVAVLRREGLFVAAVGAIVVLVGYHAVTHRRAV